MRALHQLGALILACVFAFLAGCNIALAITDGLTVYRGGIVGITVVLTLYHTGMAVKAEKT